MASTNVFKFGLYAVVLVVYIDVSDAQYPATGIVSRDPFQQPPFFHEPVGDIFAEGRRSRSRSPRQGSYSNYGSRVKRSFVEYQQFQKEIATIHESTRVKRQTPMYQTWDFHPSSIARERAVDNVAPMSHQNNRPNLSAAKPTAEQFGSQYKVPSNGPTSNIVKPLQPNQINAAANEQLPFTHFNTILEQNNLALEPKGSNVVMDTTKRNAAHGTQHTKQTDTLKGRIIKNKDVVSKNSKVRSPQKTTGPRDANSMPNSKTASQLQFDLTLAAAALLNGDKSFEALMPNNVKNKHASSGNKVASDKKQHYDKKMMNNIQHLKSIIDRTEKILMKKRNKEKPSDTILPKAISGKTKTIRPKVRMPKQRPKPDRSKVINKQIPKTKTSSKRLSSTSKIKGGKYSKQTLPQNNMQYQSIPSQAAVTQTQSPQRPDTQLNMQHMPPQNLDLPAQMSLKKTLRQEPQTRQQLNTQSVQQQPNQGMTAMHDLPQLQHQMLNMMISQTQTDPKEVLRAMQQQFMQQQILNENSNPKGLQLLNDQQYPKNVNPQIQKGPTPLLLHDFKQPTKPSLPDLNQPSHEKSQLKKSNQGKQMSSKFQQQPTQRQTPSKKFQQLPNRPSQQSQQSGPHQSARHQSQTQEILPDMQKLMRDTQFNKQTQSNRSNQKQQANQNPSTIASVLQHTQQNLQQHKLNNQNKPTPRPLSPTYQTQHRMLNNQNEPALSMNYQNQQGMLNNQNEPTPRPLSPNYQSQQGMLNTQNQPTSRPLSSNYQSQQGMLNTQNQPTSRPLSSNYQSQQGMLNTQNQPTPQPPAPNYQSQQGMLNTQNQPTSRPSSPNYQSQQGMLNTQNQPTSRPSSPNYQSQQGMLNTQNQPTPRPLSSNYQSEQGMLNTQNQPTSRPLSSNYQSQQGMLNTQNQPTSRPLSPNYQSQQGMLNIQNQPTSRPLSPNYQSQQGMLNTQNQPTSRPLSPNYQSQQGTLNNQNQPTSRPLSPNYQSQQGMLNNQNQPTSRPLSPNYQSQQGMLNNQNRPTPPPLSQNYQKQQAMLTTKNQPTAPPLPPNYQSQQGMLDTQNQPTPQRLSPNYQSHQGLLNTQNHPMPQRLFTNYQSQKSMFNIQKQPTPRPLSPNYQSHQDAKNFQNKETNNPGAYTNPPTYQQQPSQYQHQKHQQLMNTQQQLPQRPEQQAGHIPLQQSPTQHRQPIPTLAPSQNNRQNVQNQRLKSPTSLRPLSKTKTRRQTLKQNQNRFQQRKNVVHGIPLPLDGLSHLEHIPYKQHRNQHGVDANNIMYKTTTTTPPPRNAQRPKQRQRIPHEQYIMYRSTTTTSPRSSLSRRQRNHSRRISRPNKQKTAFAKTNHFLEPINVWNPSPEAPVGNPVVNDWRQPVKHAHKTQSPNPTPVVPSPVPKKISSGTVNGGNYVKNWFHPRRFDSTQGNSVRPVKSSLSGSHNQHKKQTKNQTQKLSEERHRTRSKQIVSEQSRNGRRPGIRHSPVFKRPQTKNQPGRKKLSKFNRSYFSNTTVKPTTTSSTPTNVAPADLQQNSWNQPDSAMHTTPGHSTRFLWSQPTSIPPLYSPSADPFRAIKFLNANISKTDVRTITSNQSTVSDVKKNKTISITQQIKTSNNATPVAHNHAHAPINFNVFLEVKPTPTSKPRKQNSSNAGDMLRLLEAFQILKGSMRSPTTMVPPVQFVFQVEPNLQQPAKLTCKCFDKSDGCPAELKEEHLMDMCYRNNTIPCCDDG